MALEGVMEILTKSEIDMIGGGGESSVDTRSKKGCYGNGTSTNYGGQANGFVPNSSPGISAECAWALGLAAFGGGVGGAIAGSARAIAGGLVSGSIGGLSSCIGNGGGKGTQNASEKRSGSYNGGTCRW